MFDSEHFIASRMRAIDASGIRRVFDLALTLKDPINLSIGQPDFDVPVPVKEAAIQAIRDGQNRYTVTQGIVELQEKICARFRREFPGWETFGSLVTSGTSGGLLLALMACVGPGDEVLIPDPYFVMYRHLVTLAGGTPVYIDTYPDFQLTPQRIEPHITPRSKLLLFNSPSNPTGAVAGEQTCRQVAELARYHNILLLSDEIYDEFCFEKVARPGVPGVPGVPELGFRCPSPAAYSSDILVLRGFSKTYAMTGWRLGYALGPRPIIEQMTKLQQYSFVCAPSIAQVAGVKALDLDMTGSIERYRARRDRVVARLSGTYELTVPGGAFYAFPRVPPALGMTGSQFVEHAIERNLLIIPGSVFSRRDTHFRISYTCGDAMLDRGLDLLLELARGR